jgi:hypothetical protein
MEMNEDIWFEDALLPPQELVEDTAKGLASLDERHLAAEKGLDLAALQAQGQRPSPWSKS